MTNRKKLWGVGVVLVSAAAACAPDIRELGDGPLAGTGGSSHNNAGAGSTPPPGGSSGMPPATGGTPPNAAGAPSDPAECFSPARADLTNVPGSIGCPCEGDERVCITVESDDAPAFECVDGRWKLDPSGCAPSCVSPTNFARAHDPAAVGCECDDDEPVCVDFGGNDAPARFECVEGRWKLGATSCIPCFSPTVTPQLALTSGIRGCACSDEPAECVHVTHDGEPRNLALSCVAGRWTSADAASECDSLAPRCRVGGVSYPSGARGISSPYSLCNKCDCVDGELVNCTTNDCADTRCGDGSYRARRCLGCGPADDCTEYEIGCLSGDGCETGRCTSPQCG